MSISPSVILEVEWLPKKNIYICILEFKNELKGRVPAFGRKLSLFLGNNYQKKYTKIGGNVEKYKTNIKRLNVHIKGLKRIV